MPRLPVEDIDVLVVDRMGKEISGVGLDPNIIGRIRIAGQPEPSSPRIKALMVSELSPHSYGNAIGIGLADVISGSCMIRSISKQCTSTRKQAFSWIG